MMDRPLQVCRLSVAHSKTSGFFSSQVLFEKHLLCVLNNLFSVGLPKWEDGGKGRDRPCSIH